MISKTLKGRLVLSIGETLLSGWEAARLKAGDIVLSRREAGYPNFVLFNNLPVGLGEVVVRDKALGVKVVDSDFRPSFRVDPGRQEALGLLVPAYIGLGALETEVAALSGWTSGSIFDLGVPYSGRAEADLWYGGLLLARGIVVVAGELMGLRVTERLLDLPAAPVLTSGNVDPAVAHKDFDFSRPDRFSALQIRRLGEIHDLFRRNLEYSLPEAPRAGAAPVVDQCTWTEALDFLAKNGLEHRLVLGQPQRPGRSLGRSLVFSHASSPVFAAPVLAECLRNGWKRFLDFPLAPERDPEFPNGTDMVIIVLFYQAGSPERPFLVVVYPYSTLEPVLNVLGS